MLKFPKFILSLFNSTIFEMKKTQLRPVRIDWDSLFQHVFSLVLEIESGDLDLLKNVEYVKAENTETLTE